MGWRLAPVHHLSLVKLLQRLSTEELLRSSGLAVGGIAAVTALSGKMVKPALATTAGGNISVKKSVCSHCAVGCTVMAEVQDGVWTGQEPGWDSP